MKRFWKEGLAKLAKLLEENEKGPATRPTLLRHLIPYILRV